MKLLAGDYGCELNVLNVGLEINLKLMIKSTAKVTCHYSLISLLFSSISMDDDLNDSNERKPMKEQINPNQQH